MALFKARLFVLFGILPPMTLAGGCRERVDGEIAANSGLLGTWQVAITRCASHRDGSQRDGVLLTDKDPCAKKLMITRRPSGAKPGYSVLLSVLSGCNGEWRTVTLSSDICSPLEVEMRSENKAENKVLSGRALFDCRLPDIGVVKGSLRFTGCR